MSVDLSPIHYMPTEILWMIFLNLDECTLGNSRAVCKAWGGSIGDEQFLDAYYAEPEEAFGRKKWKAFGEIGKVSLLPFNIRETLEKVCPFFNKKIKEIYELVWVPTHINGKPNCVDVMERLLHEQQKDLEIRNPNVDDCQIFLTPVAQGRWVLVAREVIPVSPERDHEFQEDLSTCGKEAGVIYRTPQLIEVLTCIFARYVTSLGKEYLYSETATLCQERDGISPICIGYFSSVVMPGIFNTFRGGRAVTTGFAPVIDLTASGQAHTAALQDS